MRTQRCTMNNQRCFRFVVRIGKLQFKTASLRKINLVGGQCKLAPDSTPNLYIYLWSVKCSFTGNFYKRNLAFSFNTCRTISSVSSHSSGSFIYFSPSLAGS